MKIHTNAVFPCVIPTSLSHGGTSHLRISHRQSVTTVYINVFDTGFTDKLYNVFQIHKAIQLHTLSPQCPLATAIKPKVKKKKIVAVRLSCGHKKQ